MRLFIFDMGGVVAQNVHCVGAMAQTLGLTVEEFFLAAGGKPGSTYDGGDVRAIQEGRCTAEEFWFRLEGRARELFPYRTVHVPRNVEGKTVDLWGTLFSPRRDSEVVSLVEELRDRGYRVVCGTNTLPAHYEKHQILGDYDIFDGVYASHRMGVAKPDGEFWRRILEVEGILPSEAFFIDDLEENVAAARALGLGGLRFVSAVDIRKELASLGYVDPPYPTVKGSVG
jgi:putative hydrolase of the HAD superfamily